MKRSIKDPIPEIFQCWYYLNEAVDAHNSGDSEQAADLFKKADMKDVWDWLNPAWVDVHLNVAIKKPVGDTTIVPKGLRDPDRNIKMSVRRSVLKRDGYRCRYCGLPVVDANIRKMAHKHYPNEIPWIPTDAKKQHAGFQCFWLQYDHVEPHSHGGQSTEDNIVISCALCNFGKYSYTLRQLQISDPRQRKPLKSNWDGLERFRPDNE